ncbi:hypothetical protein J6590_081453 [Homalodisca vitripennis]|nr:hypothetical protein J6590_081453 [Homalodisca vitripennis]
MKVSKGQVLPASVGYVSCSFNMSLVLTRWVHEVPLLEIQNNVLPRINNISMEVSKGQVLPASVGYVCCTFNMSLLLTRWVHEVALLEIQNNVLPRINNISTSNRLSIRTPKQTPLSGCVCSRLGTVRDRDFLETTVYSKQTQTGK